MLDRGYIRGNLILRVVWVIFLHFFIRIINHLYYLQVQFFIGLCVGLFQSYLPSHFGCNISLSWLGTSKLITRFTSVSTWAPISFLQCQILSNCTFACFDLPFRKQIFQVSLIPPKGLFSLFHQLPSAGLEDIFDKHCFNFSILGSIAQLTCQGYIHFNSSISLHSLQIHFLPSSLLPSLNQFCKFILLRPTKLRGTMTYIRNYTRSHWHWSDTPIIKTAVIIHFRKRKFQLLSHCFKKFRISLEIK